MGVKSMFFHGSKSLGARYPGFFRRDDEDPKDEWKHLLVLVYVATMVQFCLTEWLWGYFKRGTLNATTQHSVWLCHFDSLKKVSSKARKQLIREYNEWVQEAYKESQAETNFSKKHFIQSVIRLKDVRSDTPSRSPSRNNCD
ncbi:hypothetical protein FRC11_013312 [Ceratobasidium sp. 423]|nr:hypothetical protein FRC11_013312 [Ceratobasidium sp. 423]